MHIYHATAMADHRVPADRLRCGGWSAVRVTYPRLASTQIRAASFPPARVWQRGVDADEVYAFLARVADEVELMMRDVAVARAESDRVKAALRDWQTRHARGERR